MSTPALLGLLLVTTLSPGPAFGDLSRLAAERLDTGPDAVRWDGPQFIQADKKGRVFLLRSQTLSVYSLDANGQLGEPAVLVAAAPPGFEPAPVAFAALSPAGDDWLLGSRDEVPRWFPGGREKALPELPQWPSGVGFAGSTPIVAVLPLGRSESAPPPRMPGENPLLLELSGTQWSVRSRFDYQPADASTLDRKNLPRWANLLGARRLAARADGRLWLAHVHAYHLELQSPSGKSLAQVQVGPAQGRFRQRTDKETDKLLSTAPRLAGKDLGVLPVYVVVGLGAGRDGRAYLVIQDSGTLFLDRFDPDEGTLERVELGGANGSNFTLAAGKDGLYLAPYHGLAGRYRIAWEALDAAHWTPVRDAQITGITPAPAPAPR